jgi:hypothetical protein
MGVWVLDVCRFSDNLLFICVGLFGCTDSKPSSAAAVPAAAAAAAAPAAAPGGGGGGSYPAHEVLKMPALSPTMSQGNIVSWNKQVGGE